MYSLEGEREPTPCFNIEPLTTVIYLSLPVKSTFKL